MKTKDNSHKFQQEKFPWDLKKESFLQEERGEAQQWAAERRCSLGCWRFSHVLSRKGLQQPALIQHLALLGAGGWTR